MIPMEIEGQYRLRYRWEAKRWELTTGEKRQARAALWGLLGQKKCGFCGLALDPRLLHVAYDIHHELPAGTPGRNILPKLKLSHHSCNAPVRPSKGLQTQYKQKTGDTQPITATEQVRQIIDYSKGPTQVQINGEAEVPYRAWLWFEIVGSKGERYEKQEAINSGAEHCGVSKQATRDYLDKLISKEGPMEEFKENGVKFVRIKKERLE